MAQGTAGLGQDVCPTHGAPVQRNTYHRRSVWRPLCRPGRIKALGDE